MCHAQGKPSEKVGRKATGLNQFLLIGSGVADGKGKGSVIAVA